MRPTVLSAIFSARRPVAKLLLGLLVLVAPVLGAVEESTKVQELPVDGVPEAVSAAAATVPAPVTASEEISAIPSQEQVSELSKSLASSQQAVTGSTPVSAVKPLSLLGATIAPGETRRLLWVASETSYGSRLETPVYVIRGASPGRTLCLTSAIHGDELNGVEIVRQLVSDLSPDKLYGTVIGVPIVNLLGFTRGSRYLPDRRDLNRYFPGNPEGSSASRIAYSFFEDIVRHCDLLIDLHTGSLNRTNMPQVRANLEIPEVLEFTTKFGSTAVLHSRKLSGNLRSAATAVGIPAVALELGEPRSLQMPHVNAGVEIIESVLSALDMTRKLWTAGDSQPVFYTSRWIRVNYGGLLISKVEVGEAVRQGALLGTMVNPLTSEIFEISSPYSGRVLGMALNQFMLPGNAAFHIGIVADEDTAVVAASAIDCAKVGMEGTPGGVEFGCSPDAEEEVEEMEQEDKGLQDFDEEEES